MTFMMRSPLLIRTSVWPTLAMLFVALFSAVAQQQPKRSIFNRVIIGFGRDRILNVRVSALYRTLATA